MARIAAEYRSTLPEFKRPLRSRCNSAVAIFSRCLRCALRSLLSFLSSFFSSAASNFDRRSSNWAADLISCRARAWAALTSIFVWARRFKMVFNSPMGFDKLLARKTSIPHYIAS